MVTWLSFQYGPNPAFRLLCLLNMIMQLCVLFSRCFNSMCILCICTRTDKTRDRSAQVFRYEDETIFIDFPEYNYIKVNIHWMKLCKMSVLITWREWNKICAWRFIVMDSVRTTPNLTTLNIKIYIWTVVFNLHNLCLSSCMTAFIRKGLFVFCYFY